MGLNLGFKPVNTGERYFISYNNADAERVGRITRWLYRMGVPMWFDGNIRYDEGWEKAIYENIIQSKNIIMFVTRDVFQKPNNYLVSEYDFACHHAKDVYCVWLDDPTSIRVHRDLVPFYNELAKKQGLIVTDKTSQEIARIMIDEFRLTHGKKSQSTTTIYPKVIDKQGDNTEWDYESVGLAMGLATNFGFEPVKTGERYFISYKTEDTERVGHIARCLNQRGVPMWYDYGIEKGERWEPEINKNIRECKDVILFATRNVFGHKDTYLEKEFKLAKYHSKKVYVVWLERPEKKYIHPDLVPWYVDVDDLHGLITTSEVPDEIAWRMIKEIPLIDGRTPQASTPIYCKDISVAPL